LVPSSEKWWLSISSSVIFVHSSTQSNTHFGKNVRAPVTLINWARFLELLELQGNHSGRTWLLFLTMLSTNTLHPSPFALCSPWPVKTASTFSKDYSLMTLGLGSQHNKPWSTGKVPLNHNSSFALNV
jgi:hypothetical protein